jgi:hypothetical protein
LITLAMILQCGVISEPMRGQVATPASEQKATIHGVVINSVTHEPVGHALVFSGDGRLGTFTDDQGRFEFVLPRVDTSSQEGSAGSKITVSFSSGVDFSWWLNARKPGFLDPPTDPFSRRWGQIPATGVPPASGVELTIPLTPEALIFGKVNLPGASGADRITVQLQRRRVVDGRARWEEATGVSTRANGEFRLFGLEAGTYKLLTHEVMDRDPLTADPRGPMMGYPPVYFPNASDFQSAATIELKAGATFQAELSPVKQAYYPVKIPIANPPEGGNMMVEVTVQGRKGPGFALGYNEAEQRIEGALPNGTYVVEAMSQGRQMESGSGSETIVIKGAALEAPAITLAPGSTVQVKTKLDFKPNSEVPRQSISMSATVGIREGRGQDFIVRLEPVDEARDLGGSVSSGGDLMTFGGLLPGQYWMKIEALRGYVAAATLGDVNLLRRPLTVGRGETLAVDVTLKDDGAKIAGTIEGLDGSAVAEASGRVEAPFGEAAAYVYCVPLPDSSGQFRQAQATRDGKFELQQVAPGAYRVMAFAHPQNEMEYHNSETMRAYDAMGQVIRVSAGQKESLRLPLLAGSE